MCVVCFGISHVITPVCWEIILLFHQEVQFSTLLMWLGWVLCLRLRKVIFLKCMGWSLLRLSAVTLWNAVGFYLNVLSLDISLFLRQSIVPWIPEKVCVCLEFVIIVSPFPFSPQSSPAKSHSSFFDSVSKYQYCLLPCWASKSQVFCIWQPSCVPNPSVLTFFTLIWATGHQQRLFIYSYPGLFLLSVSRCNWSLWSLLQDSFIMVYHCISNSYFKSFRRTS